MNYALFIWSAYGASAVVLGAAAVISLTAHARARRMVSRLEGEDAATRGASADPGVLRPASGGSGQ